MDGLLGQSTGWVETHPLVFWYGIIYVYQPRIFVFCMVSKIGHVSYHLQNRQKNEINQQMEFIPKKMTGL